jgi:hypothetical protein
MMEAIISNLESTQNPASQHHIHQTNSFERAAIWNRKFGHVFFLKSRVEVRQSQRHCYVFMLVRARLLVLCLLAAARQRGVVYCYFL